MVSTSSSFVEGLFDWPDGEKVRNKLICLKGECLQH